MLWHKNALERMGYSNVDYSLMLGGVTKIDCQPTCEECKPGASSIADDRDFARTLMQDGEGLELGGTPIVRGFKSTS